ncbi:N-acyl-D-amino-acid deacylase family protein [Sandaracinus amylolyticus]|uniref:D-aminoacylase n=1 Tax=Sandaracinus amylolyticus TaxID=927083 RepID=A0A0F6W9E8_9BACT|nr:amidohydrolase family protein [Sandaracinus amylolyticus]AKF10721.1 D-aminoacylase [Sandaracinus amylolyticus]
MAYDLAIVNGMVVDGTGAPARRADVGVKDGRIVAIGALEERAARTIDAEGALVTPGFVDLHTHYDGQASWDASMLPSSAHGVTTAVMGNCGVGFAPVRPRDRERLIALMEGVEDIPGSALAEGIRWEWEQFGEYLDALDRRPRTIDVAAQVPHDALRVYVMGERAVAGGRATDDDVAGMRAMLRAALEQGALGFSTGRSDNHRAKDGSETPAADAEARELAGIARAFEGLGRGVLQAVSDFDMHVSPERFDPEFDVLEAMAEAAGRPLAISTLQRDSATDQWRKILARIERASARGVTMNALVAPRPIGVILGLDATFHPFIGFPSYKAIAHLPLAERVAILSRPDVKAKLLSERSEKVAGDGSPIPPLADQLLAAIDFVAMRLFRMGATPSYEPQRQDALFAEAMRRGVPALEVVYDALLEESGNALLYFPLYNYGGYSLDDVAEMLHHPRAMVSLGDGGAHVGTICDASMFTYFLVHWARDRERGRFSIEDAVRKLTSEPARWAGLVDRGEIAIGRRADLNVIELDRLALRAPRLVRDLPAGGKRFLQDAIGYRATIVRGEPIAIDGALTGATPGRIVRAS